MASGFDLASTARGVRVQFQLFDHLVDALTPEQFAAPTRLGDWTVAQLVGHIAVSNLARYLSGESAANAEVDILAWAQGCAEAAPEINERAEAMADEARPAELRAAIHEMRLVVDAGLAAPSAEFIVPARFGAMRLADYLATRCVELTVHTLDLAAALGVDTVLDRDAAGNAVKLLMTVLSTVAPGRSVEVRVPPHAAVQVVEGPRHTRGTPGSVVESDAVTWLELTTGRLSWRDAVADGRVSASGERGDLSPYLPLIS